jgi:hypothetical protein
MVIQWLLTGLILYAIVLPLYNNKSITGKIFISIPMQIAIKTKTDQIQCLFWRRNSIPLILRTAATSTHGGSV